MLRSGITVELCRVAEKGSDDLLNKKRKIKRKMQPIIKKDPRYQEEVEETPQIIVIDGDDDPDLENEQDDASATHSNSVYGSTDLTPETSERPVKRRRISEPTTRCDSSDRGSSPDIPLLIATAGIS